VSDLRISGLTKSFDGHIALDDVSLDADAGELLTLLGPSGCGKSTTLWSIGGLHRPDAGTITIGGTVVFDGAAKTFVPPERRECGVVFQSYAVWPNMSVAENVAYPLKLRRIKGRARDQRVAEVLELVELGDLAHRYPHQLSGGQQQRVALARALAHPPRLLLLDEPFSNLDAKLRERARVWLRSLQREIEVTTIFVTHDQDEALSLSDRIAVMSEGRIRQLATPEAVYNEPADLFVADFVGTINRLDGTVVGADGDALVVQVDGVERPLHVTAGSGLVPRGPVTVAFRPESILVHEDCTGTTADDSTNVWKVAVVDAAYLGDHYSYRVELAGTPVTVQTTHAVSNDGHLTIEIPPARIRAHPRQEPEHG
jgi:iron(III) transport system ATP-binding protein